MPTPSEQKALAFIAIIALLGGAARVVRANSAPQPTPAEQQGIARQASAAESAGAKVKTSRRGRGGKAAKDTTPHVVGGVASVPPMYARPDQPFARSPYGYPPPGPRIDVVNRAPSALRPTSTAPLGRASSKGLDTAPVDLDAASEAEIERLPRIGPAMARKIVANRDSLGPFKSIEGLRRVKGIGVATATVLADHVSFSGARSRP